MQRSYEKNAYLAITTPHQVCHGYVIEVNFISRVWTNVPLHTMIITELCYLVKLRNDMLRHITYKI
jgi:hypothetical protein